MRDREARSEVKFVNSRLRELQNELYALKGDFQMVTVLLGLKKVRQIPEVWKKERE